MTKTVSCLANPLVVAVAYDGLCTFEFGVAVEVFGLPRPEMGAEWYRFAVAAAEPGELRAMGGVRLATEGGLDLLEKAGTIIIPGWRDADAAVPVRLCEALQQASLRGARILSICSGVFVLAAAGLLNHRRATTHWRYIDKLKARYPLVNVTPDVLYIDEGNLLTSAGSAAGIDLCLHLIRRDFGTAAANSVARRLVVSPHRDGNQLQRVERPVPVMHESQRFAPLFDYLHQHLAEPHRVASLAARVQMSPRTFLRRFSDTTGSTPARWLLQERLNRARDLLAHSDLTIEQIAGQVGFGSSATLRHHFRQAFNLSPIGYRKNKQTS